APPVDSRAVGSYPTLSPLPRERGGLLSAALSLGFPPPGVTRHRVPWSPDFPHTRPFDTCARGRPASWQDAIKGGTPQIAIPKAWLYACHTVLFTCRECASPSRSRRKRSDSCAWRHDRHCVSESHRKWSFHQGDRPWPNTASPTLCWSRDDTDHPSGRDNPCRAPSPA